MAPSILWRNQRNNKEEYDSISSETSCLHDTIEKTSSAEEESEQYNHQRDYYYNSNRSLPCCYRMTTTHTSSNSGVNKPLLSNTRFLLSIIVVLLLLLIVVIIVFVITLLQINNTIINNHTTNDNEITKKQKIERYNIEAFNQLMILNSMNNVSRSSSSRNAGAAESVTNSTNNDSCEVTITILRHCDKGNIEQYCNRIGYERSHYIANELFGDNSDKRWPKPSYLFATPPEIYGYKSNTTILPIGKRNVHREIETLIPLSKKFNLPINTDYNSSYINDFATNVLFGLIQNPNTCSKLIVICWKHSEMSKLARLLGCGPNDGCPTSYPKDSFDQIWEIKYVYETIPSTHKIKTISSSSTNTMTSIEPSSVPSWNVYGYVQYENFDPLSYNKELYK